MASPAKYLFDLDFGKGADTKPTVTIAEHAAKLREAEDAGYHRGFAAAQLEEKTQAERRAAAAFERIAQTLEGMSQSLAAVEAQLETEAVEVAVAVAKKLTPQLLAREPFAEIAALATECFRHLIAAPHLVVRVNDDLQETAQRELQNIVRARGFEGRLVVLAEPGIARGDCRIEWADGGVTRNRAIAERVIDDAVGRYIAGRQPYVSDAPNLFTERPVAATPNRPAPIVPPEASLI